MSSPERIERIEEPTELATAAPPATEISQEQATKVLLEAQQKRISACEAELQQVLQKHGCTLLPLITLVGGSAPQAEVRVVPRQ